MYCIGFDHIVINIKKLLNKSVFHILPNYSFQCRELEWNYFDTDAHPRFDLKTLFRLWKIVQDNERPKATSKT